MLLSWKPPSNHEEVEITGYAIRTPATGEVRRVSAEQRSTTILGLRNGVAVELTVAALTARGAGPAASVTSTPASGVEGVVAGIIVGLEAGQNLAAGDSVPGEAGVVDVDLSVDRALDSDVALVSLSDAVSLEEARQIADEIAADPAVAWAEPDQFLFPAGDVPEPGSPTPDDSRYGDQWSLWDTYGIGMGDGEAAANVTSAYDPGSAAGVTVAVIDTGITAHPDLDAAIVPGYDFVSDVAELSADREGVLTPFDSDGQPGWDANPTDPGDWATGRASSWHGTKVAGVIAARAGNAEGIVGVASGANMAPIRALSWRGGLLSDVTAAITWASGGAVEGVGANTHPAKVINMSFAVEAACSRALQSAIDAATDRGSLLVAAAGNANADVSGYAPANCANVLAVGATGRDGRRASYSNYGDGIDISAPGGAQDGDQGILTTGNEGATLSGAPSYGRTQGTSIAAALVSGAAARRFAADSTQTPEQLRTALVGRQSVRTFAGDACDADGTKFCGSGILRLFQASAGDLPDAPTNVVATPILEGVRLAYTAPTYTGTSAISGYVVQRQYHGGGAFENCVERGTGRSSMTGNPVNVYLNSTWGAWNFRIAAVNASGQGPWSDLTTGGTYANSAFAGVRVTAPDGGSMPNLVAGTPTLVRVSAIDTNGRTYTEFTGRVSVTATNIQYGYWLGDITITANGWAEGNVTATGARDYLGRLNQHTIRTYYNTNQSYSPASSVFSISPGPATQLVALLPGQSIRTGSEWERGIFGGAATQTAGTPLTVNVYATDVYLNQTSATPTVALTSSDSNATLSPTSGALSSGARSFTVTPRTAGTATFTATDQASSSPLTTHTTGSVTINPGAATKLQVLLPGESAAPGTASGKTGSPTAVTAGGSVSLTVRAVDDNWNLVTSANPTVGITSSASSAVLPSDAALTSGVGTFTVTAKANDNPTFTATRISGTPSVSAGTSAALTVNPASATRLQVLLPGESAAPGTVSGKTGSPSPVTTGDVIPVTVNAVDAYWNVVPSASPTVAITSTSSTAVLPSTGALSAGAGTFSVTVKAAGSPTITATDQAGSSPLSASTSAAVTVSAGAATKLQVLLPGELAAPGTTSGKTGSPTGQAAGTAVSVTVNATDDYWNVVSSATPTVSISSSDSGAALPDRGALSSGTAQFPVTFATSGSSTVTASQYSGSPTVIPSTSAAVTVTFSTPSRLRVVSQPVAGVSGAVLGSQPVVRVEDVYGNLVTDSTVTVTVAASGGSLGGTQASTGVTAVGGVATFTNLSFAGLATGAFVLTFSASGVPASGVSSVFAPTGPGAATRLVLVTDPVAGRAGSVLSTQPVVQVQDSGGNVVTGSSAVVSASVSVAPSVAELGGAQAGSGVAASSGVATFTNLTYGGPTSTPVTVTFSSPGLASVTAAVTSTGSGPAVALTMLSQPVAGASGEMLSSVPGVRIVDAYGNLATDATSTSVTVYSFSGGVLGGVTTRSPSVGIPGDVVFPGLTFAGLVSQAYELTFMASGLTSVVSAPIQPTAPGTATQLVVVNPPVAGAVSALMSTQPSIEVQDSAGNRVTAGASRTVTVSTSAGVLGGAQASSGVDTLYGLANFANLTYAGSNSTPATLTFTTAGLPSATATITATGFSTPSRLRVVSQPVAGVSGAVLGSQPVVRVEDVYGNLVTNSTVTVTVTASGGSLGGTQASTGVAAVGGVATFTNLTLAGLVGTDYSLTFSSGALTTAQSSDTSPTGYGSAASMSRVSTDAQSAVAGATVSAPPSVRVVDSGGNPVPGVPVTFTVAGGGGSRAPTAPVTTGASGIATLTAWTLGTTAGANALEASATGLTGSPVTFTASGIPGTATALKRVQSISGAASGAAFTTQPRISIVDANDNVVTSDSSTLVTASISSGGSLVGVATAVASNGIATFSDLGLTGVSGTPYTVTFSATGLTGVDQAVTASTGPAARLVVSTPPAGATYGNVWTTQPVVQVQDSGGNLVTTDSTTTVTLAITGQTLTGTTTVTASSGVATFTGLSLTAAPASYPLVFTAGTGISLFGTAPTLALGRASQSLTFGALADKTYGDAAFTVGATASSSLTVAFASRTTAVCSVAGTTVTIIRAGVCTVRASQTGDANFMAAEPEDQSFTIAQAVPTFGWSNSAATFGDAPHTITAPTASTAGSFTYSSASTSVITMSGAQVTIRGGGSSLITATFTPTDSVNYATSGTVTSTIQVDRGAQGALTVSSVLGTYGTPVNLASTGGSGAGAVAFAVTSTGSAGCSLSGGGTTLTAAAAGTCSVTATKAQDTDYNAVSSAATTVTFQRATQSAVVLLSTGGTFGTPVTLAATGGSGTGAISFAVISAGTAGCSLTGGGTTLTAASAGTCTVTATRAEDANHLAGTSPASTVTVDRASQTVTFGGLANRTFGDAPFPVVASVSSGLTVAIVSMTTSVCTVSGVTVTLVGAGTCSLYAVQAGSANYLPAVSVNQPFEVARTNQVPLAISSTSTVAFGALTTLTTSGGSGSGGVTFSVVAGDCSISAGILTVGEVGSLCRVEAEKSDDAAYFATTSPEQAITVVRAGQLLTFATSVTASPTPGATYTPMAVSTSSATGSATGIPVELAIADASSDVCSMSAGVVTFDAIGVCVIEADAAQTARYTTAPQQTQTITVVPVPAPAPRPAAPSPTLEPSAPVSAPTELPVTALTATPPTVPLRPGQGAVLVDGVPVVVTTSTNPSSTGLVMAGLDWGLSLAPVGADGRPAPLGNGGGLVLQPSGSLPLAASGYSANSSVFVYLMSTPVLLGVLQVDASGAMSGALELPRNLAPGSHTLQINGFSSSGGLRSVSLGVTVAVAAPILRPSRLRVLFDYGSAELTAGSRRALASLVRQVISSRSSSNARDSSAFVPGTTTVVGAIRQTGATPADRAMAERRARNVAAFLRFRGLVGVMRTLTRPTSVSNQARDRFVEVRIEPPALSGP